MEKPTQEQLNRWYEHKSNKEAWIEAEQARQDEIQEDTTSMEEKLIELHNDPKADILADMIRSTCIQRNQPGHSFCNKD